MRRQSAFVAALLLLAAVVVAPAHAAEMEKSKTPIRDRMEQRIQDREDQIKMKREELQTKLKAIKDEKKAQIAQKLADDMNKLNARLTEHYNGVLDQLETVLGRISDRAAQETSNADLQAKIEAAKTKIASVRDAVAKQADKVYTVNVTTEDKLRSDFQAVKKQMQDDHAAMRELLTQARQSVKSALEQLKQIAKPDTTEPSTNS